MAHLLVVDDELHIRELLVKVFNIAGHRVATATNSQEALLVINRESFDLIILDNSMPGETGVSLLKKIRASQNQTPIIIFSGFVTSKLEAEAKAGGATDVLSKGLELGILKNSVERILKTKGSPPKETNGKPKEKLLLIVDDEKSMRELLVKFFSQKNYKIVQAENGEEAVEFIKRQEQTPDVVLLDMNMTGMDGLATLKKLLELKPHLGVVMTTADTDDQKVKQAIQIGAYGYVLKPFDFLYLELVVASKLVIAKN